MIMTVTVGTVEDGVYLADDGPGIPAEDREAVRAVGCTATTNGMGFGSRVVSEIAAAHG